MKYYYPLSTGDISKYCHMSTSTVRKWIKSGRLKAYTTPDGQYRVELIDFRGFLERYGMPIREGYFDGDDENKVPGAEQWPQSKVALGMPKDKINHRRNRVNV